MSLWASYFAYTYKHTHVLCSLWSCTQIAICSSKNAAWYVCKYLHINNVKFPFINSFSLSGSLLFSLQLLYNFVSPFNTAAFSVSPGRYLLATRPTPAAANERHSFPVRANGVQQCAPREEICQRHSLCATAVFCCNKDTQMITQQMNKFERAAPFLVLNESQIKRDFFFAGRQQKSRDAGSTRDSIPFERCCPRTCV